MSKIDLVKIVDKIWINEGKPNNVNKVFAITCLQELEEQLILSNVANFKTIKFIVKYRTQKWDGNEYIYPENCTIIDFKNIEDVTGKNIINKITTNWVEILDISRVLV